MVRKYMIENLKKKKHSIICNIVSFNAKFGTVSCLLVGQ